MSGVIAYVGLGSNIDDPASQLRSAMDALAGLAATRVLRQSGFYRSAPWGYAEQPDFINAVAELETGLSAQSLLAGLLEIEKRAGRERGPTRWGPRSIDLDLLLFGDLRVRVNGLELPHPRMRERAFVLVPLAELDSSLEVPGAGSVSELLKRVDATTCVPIR